MSDKDIPLMAIVTYNKSDMATGSSGQYTVMDSMAVTFLARPLRISDKSLLWS